jgi:hypothetical protein
MMKLPQQEDEAIILIDTTAAALAKFNHADALTILGCLAELVFQSVPTEVRPNTLKAWTNLGGRGGGGRRVVWTPECGFGLVWCTE